jgi:dephospho-CoA kinase
MVVGVTGGIGSGKSVIANELRMMGYPVYDSDSQAKRIIQENLEVREKIVQLLGATAFENGVYQTAVVAKKVFSDPNLLLQLNAIVHPAVREDFILWCSAQSSTIKFVECAIICTAGIDALCDRVVLVLASDEIRIQRVMKRDNCTAEKVMARIHAQADEYSSLTDAIIIQNDGVTPPSELCKYVIGVLESLSRIS